MLDWREVQELEAFKHSWPTKVLSESERATVSIVADFENSTQYVVKMGPISPMLQTEANCLQELNHPNIIKCYSVYVLNGHLILKLERAPGVGLVNYILDNGPFPETLARLLMSQLVSALCHIHNSGWIHRDLKADNVIYDKQTHTIKLVDFEFACKWSRWRSHSLSLGTVEYSAPELREKKKYRGPELDMWSLGVTMYVMVAGKFPFSRQELLTLSEELECPPHLSSQCQDLLRSLLERNPKKRLSMKNLRQHPWIREPNFSRTSTSPVSVNRVSSLPGTVSGSPNRFFSSFASRERSAP